MTKVLIDGDPVFLYQRKIPHIVNRLEPDMDAHCIDTSGFSYWFAKAAPELRPITVVNPEDYGAKRLQESERALMMRYMRENQIKEYWFVTTGNYDSEAFYQINLLGCTVRVMDVEGKDIETYLPFVQ
jgi:hypothetical protein